ncbi:MAG: helix-turn-helix domain-containing protein [Burkholderiales bacterium]|nr:helix-turn-helix domain-containing protein [Burkholderiales bacterium]
MDSLIAASARALAAGDALGALRHVALRDDPSALALRGIAMAQLGEYARARDLLRRAARSFGPREALARARCVVADAEVALALRELGGSPRALADAVAVLEAHGDSVNARHARAIGARRNLLLGRRDAAAEDLAGLDADRLPPSLSAVAWLTLAEIALRGLRTSDAAQALARAQAAAAQSRIPALMAEVSEAHGALQRPAARRVGATGQVPIRLADVESLLASNALVLDACRRGVAMGGAWLPLARRPILFSLARTLAEAWPGDATRDALIAQAFRMPRPDETHRARLRVEIGRLRTLLKPLAGVEATRDGFALKPRDGAGVSVLAPPLDGEQGALLALLADGAAWSTSALALALGTSQRSVQRALAELECEGRVRAAGRARARRWLSPPLAGFTPILLLPASLPLA